MSKIIKTNKKDRVLAFLRTGSPLTAVQAHHYCGTMHLSQIISDLRQEGHSIVSSKKRDLEGDQYVVYRMVI